MPIRSPAFVALRCLIVVEKSKQLNYAVLLREYLPMGEIVIRKLIVDGLNSKISDEFDFYPDINLLTGRNGAGKTTFLKLLWYLNSGHINILLRDIEFKYVEMHGDDYILKIENSEVSKSKALVREEEDDDDESEIETSHIIFYLKGEKLLDTKVRRDSPRGPRGFKLEAIEETISKHTQSSVFFPTFRRIEYSIGSGSSSYRSDRFHETISSYSERLSKNRHSFITAISTKDIVDLLKNEYAKISNEFITMNINFSEIIKREITHYKLKNSQESIEKATGILTSIMDRVDQLDQRRNQLMKPISELNNFISDIFEDKGIKLTDNIKFGYEENTMLSEKLSAGEQQMLSFLCYNAFLDNSAVFIDEPELSLHVDWQRDLFPILSSQSKNNQFFVATHSPFIYSRYESNEIILSENRGWNNG